MLYKWNVNNILKAKAYSISRLVRQWNMQEFILYNKQLQIGMENLIRVYI